MTAKQKRVFLVSTCAALFLACGVHVSLLPVDVTGYKTRVEAAVSAALGVEFRIGGTMEIVLFPDPGLSLDDVHIHNLGVDLVSAGKVRMGFMILPLLRREVRIRELTIADPQFSVERDGKGRLNFEPLWQKLNKEFPRVFFNARKLSVTNGRLLYSDQ